MINVSSECVLAPREPWKVSPLSLEAGEGEASLHSSESQEDPEKCNSCSELISPACVWHQLIPLSLCSGEGAVESRQELILSCLVRSVLAYGLAKEIPQ